MARRRRISRRRNTTHRSYGIAVRENPLPLIAVAGAGALGVGILGSMVAFGAYSKLVQPIPLVGSAVGTVVGYKYGRGFWERAAYTSLGTAVGVALDSYLNPQESVWYKPWTWLQ